MSDKKFYQSLTLIVLLSIYPFLIKLSQFYLNSYFITLILVFSLVYLIEIKKKSTTPLYTLNTIDFSYLALAFLIPTGIALVYINKYSIWLDEFEEFRAITYYKEILCRAAQGQQPVLSYFFRKIGIALFGINEFGLRISSTFFLGLFSIVNYGLLKRITKNKLYSFLGALSISLNYLLLVYSIEARLYITSLFFQALFIYFLYEHLTIKDNSSKINFSLLISASLWLLSISMQPLFFIIIFLLFSLTLTIITKKHEWKSINYSLTSAILIYLPFLIYIIRTSKDYISHSFKELNSLQSFFYEDIIFIQTLFVPNKIHAGILLMMFLSFGGFFFRNQKKRNCFFISFFLCFFYFITVVILFKIKINWRLQARYLISIIPLLYYHFLYALYFCFKKRNLYFKHLVLIIVLIASLISVYADGIVKPYPVPWRELYKLMSEKTSTQSQAYVFFFENPSQWCGEYFIAKEFYPDKKVQFPAMDDMEFPIRMTNDLLYENFKTPSDTSQIFFIILSESLKEKYFDSLKLPNVEKIKFNNFYILNAENINLLEFTKDFYQQLKTFMKNDSNILRVYDGLFLASLFENNCAAAEKYLKRLGLEIKKYPQYEWSYPRRFKILTEKLKTTCKTIVPDK